MKIFVRTAAVIATSFLLGGCPGEIGLVKTDVTRVHTLPVELAGKKYAVMAVGDQQGRPEFQLYASDLGAQLTAHGLVQAADFNQADYVAVLSYDVDNGKSVTRTELEYVPSKTATVTATPAFSMPKNYEVETRAGYQERQVASTEYRRHLGIQLIDKSKTDEAKKANPQDFVYAFEGNAISNGESASFMAVSKCLINAIMDDFPGVSGKTKTVMGFGGNCVR